MQDFNEYSKQNENSNQTEEQTNLFNLVNSIASKYNGKNQNELLVAIYNEAKKGKKAGTLTNQDIDNFASMLSPFLDSQKRTMLNKLVKELKNI
ncbi:MAG: hypothetical protein IKW33_04025 [Clostridia bacterium]|nr:hypothetical protein [Clostridia bacterium]